jgi:hypothetical protein
VGQTLLLDGHTRLPRGNKGVAAMDILDYGLTDSAFACWFQMLEIRIVFSHFTLNLQGHVEDPRAHRIEQLDQTGSRNFLVGGLQIHCVHDPSLIVHDKVGWLGNSCLASLSLACCLLVSGYALSEVSFSRDLSVGFGKQGRWNLGLHL